MKELLAILSILARLNFQQGELQGDLDNQKRIVAGEKGMDYAPIMKYKDTSIVLSNHQIENPPNYNRGNTSATGVQIWGW